jgi:hypothetical protein
MIILIPATTAMLPLPPILLLFPVPVTATATTATAPTCNIAGTTAQICYTMVEVKMMMLMLGKKLWSESGVC